MLRLIVKAPGGSPWPIEVQSLTKAFLIYFAPLIKNFEGEIALKWTRLMVIKYHVYKNVELSYTIHLLKK